MFKRIMLTLSFAAALGTLGLCMPRSADARWSGWYGGNRPYVSYYYGPRSYGYSAPYRTYYNGYDGYYGSRGYYSSYYGDPGYYYYRSTPRVAIQVGPGPYWR